MRRSAKFPFSRGARRTSGPTPYGRTLRAPRGSRPEAGPEGRDAPSGRFRGASPRTPVPSRRDLLSQAAGAAKAMRLPPLASARRVLGLLAFVLVAAIGTSLFLSSSAFGVKEIVVIGSTHLSSDEIVRLCNVTEGTNILKVPTGEIRARLLANPRIEAATVARRLPSRILVTVTEREGVALLPCQGLYAELDASGLPIELHSFITALGLPVVTGIETSGLTLGTRLTDARLTGPLTCASALGQAGRAAVAEIHLTGSGELVLYTRGGIPAYFGDGSGLPAKVEAFLGILADIESSGLEVTYADVRYPRFPVVGSAGGPAEPAGWIDPDAFPFFEP